MQGTIFLTSLTYWEVSMERVIERALLYIAIKSLGLGGREVRIFRAGCKRVMLEVLVRRRKLESSVVIIRIWLLG